MTLSLTAVFIPVLFMGGLLGRLLHEFAVTIVVAVLVSGFVSLTLTPMMCSRFVHSETRKSTAGFTISSSGFFDWHAQQPTSARCKLVLRHRRATVIVSLMVWSLTQFLFVIIPKGFFADEDTGRSSATTEAAQDISFDAMRRHQLAAMKIVAGGPEC